MARRIKQSLSTDSSQEVIDHPFRILWISGNDGTSLHAAPHLGEYDAVVYDEMSTSVASDLKVDPGFEVGSERNVVTNVQALLGRRREEATSLLRGGGLLVVRVRAFSGLVEQNQFFGTSHPARVNLADWWFRILDYLPALADRGVAVIELAMGDTVMIEEPGHAFEACLLSTTSYAATIAQHVAHEKGATVLATNRAGIPIAAEINVGAGSLLLVPSGTTRDGLERAIVETLTIRRAHRAAWPVPEEVIALANYRAVTEELREKHAASVTELGDIFAMKERIFSEPDVAKVLRYHRKATAGTTSIRDSLRHLALMVEVLEGLYGGERQLPGALGVSLATVKSIKKIANHAPSAVRHATVGPEAEIDRTEYSEAIDNAEVLVQAFISRRYDDEKTGGRRPPDNLTL